MKTVSAAEANRHFSRILRQVASGETIEVTSHGQPVAKISPPDEDDTARKKRAEALRAHLALLRERPHQPIPKWTRAELYEDEPYPDTFK